MISFDTRTQVDMISRALPEYTVFPPLEKGSQGMVFLGEHHASHRAVAVKVLGGGPLATRAQRARFEREIETLFRLDHPNIVRTYQSGSIEGRLFYVMQRVDGPPITDFVLSHELSLRQIVELFLRVCDGLSYAHGCGVIHRDIKPGNILIQDDDGPRHGTPYVVDFGLAKVLADREGAFHTQADSPLGTPAYMSPEQIDGRGRMLDVRSDIYSLGVVMYEVLSREHFPYRVDLEPEQIRRNILKRTPTPLRAANPAVDADLSAIAGKCLEKDRALRYRSVDELADDLRRWQRGDAVEARKQHRWYRFRKTVRRHRYPIAATSIFILLLALSAASSLVLWQRAEQTTRIAHAALQMGGYLRDGSVERDQDRVNQAIEYFLSAAELGESLDSDDPYLQRHLYGAYHRLADLYLAAGNLTESAPHCLAALRIVEHQLHTYPDDQEWKRLLGFAEVLRGRMMIEKRDYDSAVLACSLAVRVRRELLECSSDDAGTLDNLALALGLLGKAQRKSGLMKEAFANYDEAHKIRLKLLGVSQSSDTQIDAVQAESQLAVWHIVQKTPDDNIKAIEWIDRAEARLSGMQSSGLCANRPRDCRRFATDLARNRALVQRRLDATP